MAVPVMDVRDMRMRMLEAVVPMRMGVRFRPFVAHVFMPVMFVVHMPVLVLDRLVKMRMGMLHPNEKPGPWNHEEGSCRSPETRDLAQEHPGEHDRKSRRGREQGGGSRRADVAERRHEAHHR